MIENKNIWIVGYGGIGSSLYDLYKNQNNVLVFSRKQNDSHNFFLVEDYSYSNIENILDSIYLDNNILPDYVFITTGILHKRENTPEKSLSQINENWLYENIEANFLPTLSFAKYLHTKLSKNHKIIFVSLSARVGSISDNKLGGWHSYRITKSMLNMLIKNISIEWKIKSKDSLIIGYHPGTVDTDLSKPFQKNINHEIFSKEKAAEYLNNVIQNLNNNQSGNLIDWQGSIIDP